MVKRNTNVSIEATLKERANSVTFLLTEMSLVKYQIVGIAN